MVPAAHPDLAETRRLAADHAEAARRWLEAMLRAAADLGPGARADVDSARRQYEQHVADHPNAPFERLAPSLALDHFEHDLLLLCWVLERWPEQFAPMLQSLQTAPAGP